jgi:antitoxin component YwqK of YwqJK toxin-antitoxin module
LRVKGTYKDGERDGPWKLYYRGGQLDTKTIFKDAERNGPSEAYYGDGQLGWKGVWKDGERCGEWLDFSETVIYAPC